MNRLNSSLSAIAVLLIIVIGCSRTTKPAMDEGDEESGTQLALSETYDKVRKGARLILNYDAQSNTFKGTVENTTDEILKQVRVEVHLSNGKELGPTTPGDLAPGEKKEIQLTATSTDFEGWTAHPEVGSGEQGHGEEGDSEHGDGEHDREGGNSEEGAGERGEGEHEREGENEHQ